MAALKALLDLSNAAAVAAAVVPVVRRNKKPQVHTTEVYEATLTDAQREKEALEAADYKAAVEKSKLKGDNFEKHLAKLKRRGFDTTGGGGPAGAGLLDTTMANIWDKVEWTAKALEDKKEFDRVDAIWAIKDAADYKQAKRNKADFPTERKDGVVQGVDLPAMLAVASAAAKAAASAPAAGPAPKRTCNKRDIPDDVSPVRHNEVWVSGYKRRKRGKKENAVKQPRKVKKPKKQVIKQDSKRVADIRRAANVDDGPSSDEDDEPPKPTRKVKKSDFEFTRGADGKKGFT